MRSVSKTFLLAFTKTLKFNPQWKNPFIMSAFDKRLRLVSIKFRYDWIGKISCYKKSKTFTSSLPFPPPLLNIHTLMTVMQNRLFNAGSRRWGVTARALATLWMLAAFHSVPSIYDLQKQIAFKFCPYSIILKSPSLFNPFLLIFQTSQGELDGESRNASLRAIRAAMLVHGNSITSLKQYLSYHRTHHIITLPIDYCLFPHYPHYHRSS